MLVHAFIDANVGNSELHLYGDGDFADELEEIARNNERIKYFGVKPNDYVVAEQLKVILLVNPRPTNEEYTRYSFPSKNMEYMVSGTPVL
jgi:glycosyltransferase involved in cell wall biosynthesis